MLKRLAGCVRQYKGASLLSPLFVVLEVIMEVIIPLLMAKLMTALTGQIRRQF